MLNDVPVMPCCWYTIESLRHSSIVTVVPSSGMILPASHGTCVAASCSSRFRLAHVTVRSMPSTFTDAGQYAPPIFTLATGYGSSYRPRRVMVSVGTLLMSIWSMEVCITGRYCAVSPNDLTDSSSGKELAPMKYTIVPAGQFRGCVSIRPRVIVACCETSAKFVTWTISSLVPSVRSAKLFVSMSARR